MWGGRTSSTDRRRGIPTPVVPTHRIPVVPHGGRPPEDDGPPRPPCVDLSLSVNPYGPPPFLRAALLRAAREADRYPDRRQSALSTRVARRLAVSGDELVLAGSASELLRCAIAGFGAGRTVLLPQFTYGEYRRVARSVGARVRTVAMPHLRLNARRFAAAIPRRGVAVLANPGTPDGRYLTPDALDEIAEAAERRRSLLVVDESYLPFVRDGVSFGRRSDAALVVFSWSKTLGTPGLPLGHALGAPSVIAAVRARLLPWSVDAVARQIGLAALDAERWVTATLERVRRTAEVARSQLGSASDAHYFAVDVGHAARATASLARRGFYVRDLTALGLGRHIRFAVRRPQETRRFLRELERLGGPGGGRGVSPLPDAHDGRLR